MAEWNKRSSREDVQKAIQRAREYIEQGISQNKQVLDIWDERKENAAFMRDYNLLPDDVKQMLLGLTLSDYDTTSYEDDNPEAYVFGIEYEGLEVYLKFSFQKKNILINVISIHEPRYAFQFPYRKEKGTSE